ncbi:MAG: hypothetical protein ACRDB2_03305, partial [Fusobacteriaceae bacterium]
KLKMGFGANTYRSEFDRVLFHLFLPVLKDEDFKFLEEEELPENMKLKNCEEDIREIAGRDEEIYDEFYEDYDGDYETE